MKEIDTETVYSLLVLMKFIIWVYRKYPEVVMRFRKEVMKIG